MHAHMDVCMYVCIYKVISLCNYELNNKSEAILTRGGTIPILHLAVVVKFKYHGNCKYHVILNVNLTILTFMHF